MNNLCINVSTIGLFLLLTSLLISNSSFAATKRYVVENQSIKMVMIPRTPQQMAAFYEGREFPSDAIKVTSNNCFFTVGIRNKSKNIIWLNTKLWQLNSENKEIPLINKQQWQQRKIKPF